MKKIDEVDITQLSPQDLEQIRCSKQVRMSIAEQSLAGFMHLYFPEYITRPTAPFHREIYKLLEDETIEHLVLMAFRGSGKSTIVTLGYPIWSALGAQGKKFILIASQTQPQAQQHLKNIKREFENNELLRKDYGPLNEISDEWGSVSLVLPKFNTRITAVSVEQSVRGIRHGAHRPDLIIADDVEDSNSVKTREGRNKVFDWYTGEVIPAGDINTKRIVVGNLLHEDSLLMRLQIAFTNNDMTGLFKSYPIVKNNKPMWPGKYPDKRAIERERKMVGNRVSWQREYCLRIVADDDQVVKRSWIQYYEELPAFDREHNFSTIYVGADLAISQKEYADYTAIVVAYLYRTNNKLKIYIEANPFCKKINFPTQRQAMATTYDRLKMIAHPHFYIENQGYQDALVQQMTSDGYPIKPFEVKGSDKRSRLALVTHKIKDGTILFPRHGAEQLIQQLTGFGVEKHDDLTDAFTMTIIQIITYFKAYGTYRASVGKSVDELYEESFDEFEGNEYSMRTRPFTAGLRNMKF